MCGRFQLQVSASDLEATYANATWRDGHDALHAPRQQVCPTTTAPVLVAINSAAGTSRPPLQPELVVMKWGFTRPPTVAQKSPPLINARRETLLDLPTFRRPLCNPNRSRRCAIPTTAFYEWHRSPPPGKTTLTPYLVRPLPQPEPGSATTPASDPPATTNEETSLPPVAFMAGVYDVVCKDTTPAAASSSFVVITTASCSQFSWLHHRQPVFLSTESQLRTWLDHTVPADEAVSILGTHMSFSCTRMLKDLSAEAPKLRQTRQTGIRSFFRKRKGEKEQGEPSTVKKRRL